MAQPQRKRMNEQIVANQVQVISEDGEKLGIMPLAEALRQAREQEKDLVEVAQNNGISIAKIIDWKKHLFEEKKQQKKQKSVQKKTELKTLRLSYAISEHDMDVRRNQAEKFHKDGHILRLELQLRGREMRFQDIAKSKMEIFTESISNIYKLDGPIKFLGRRFISQLHPITSSV